KVRSFQVWTVILRIIFQQDNLQRAAGRRMIKGEGIRHHAVLKKASPKYVHLALSSQPNDEWLASAAVITSVSASAMGGMKTPKWQAEIMITLYRMPVRVSMTARLDGLSVSADRPALTASPSWLRRSHRHLSWC